MAYAETEVADTMTDRWEHWLHWQRTVAPDNDVEIDTLTPRPRPLPRIRASDRTCERSPGADQTSRRTHPSPRSRSPTSNILCTDLGSVPIDSVGHSITSYSRCYLVHHRSQRAVADVDVCPPARGVSDLRSETGAVHFGRRARRAGHRGQGQQALVNDHHHGTPPGPPPSRRTSQSTTLPRPLNRLFTRLSPNSAPLGPRQRVRTSHSAASLTTTGWLLGGAIGRQGWRGHRPFRSSRRVLPVR